MLDEADKGVIYVSWGSLIRIDTLAPDIRQELLEAFGSFPQQIVWKFENETLPNKPENVYIDKWMPQKDILCKLNKSFQTIVRL